MASSLPLLSTATIPCFGRFVFHCNSVLNTCLPKTNIDHVNHPLSFFISCLQGAEKLGFRPEKIPRNVKDCVDCGHCCHGCPYESKQSTPTALLEPLLLSGTPHGGTCKGAGPAYKLQVIPHCHVSRVLYEDVSGEVKDAAGVSHSCRKRATGVEATVQVFEDDFSTLSVGERLKRIEKAKYHTK